MNKRYTIRGAGWYYEEKDQHGEETGSLKAHVVGSIYGGFSWACQDKGQQGDLGPNYKGPTLPYLHPLTCLNGQ